MNKRNESAIFMKKEYNPLNDEVFIEEVHHEDEMEHEKPPLIQHERIDVDNNAFIERISQENGVQKELVTQILDSAFQMMLGKLEDRSRFTSLSLPWLRNAGLKIKRSNILIVSDYISFSDTIKKLQQEKLENHNEKEAQ